MGRVRLHHRISGPEDAPALLLAPSLGANLKMWDLQLPLADQGLRLVRFDHRGHGGSPTPPGPYTLADLGHDVIALLDALELPTVSFCGISMGGMVGMWLAANAPERIDKLVLVCTSAHMPPPEAWEERAQTVLGAGSTEPIADGVVDRWMTPEFAAASPEVRADLRAMLIATPPEGYAWCCAAIQHMDLRGDLPRIQAPTLVVSATDDASTPRPMQEQIAAAIPRARHETVGPAAHIAAAQQPEQLNALIAAHLAPDRRRQPPVRTGSSS